VKRTLTKQQAILAALFPVVALSLLNHFYEAALYRLHPLWFWASDVVQYVIAPAVGFMVLRRAGIGLADCGLGWQRKGAGRNSIGFVIFVALLLLAVTWPVFRIANAFLWQYAESFSVHGAMPTSRNGKWLVALYMSATAAVVEETAYRALPWLYVSAVVPGRWRRVTYVLVTSTVFAISHSEQGPGGVIAAGWFGLIAALMYSGMPLLWPLMLGHFTVDLLLFGPW
jgi:hypothetical protein